MGRLAYKLELPPKWRIHPIISIAHLEPAPTAKDPFNQPFQDQPEAVIVDGEEEWTVEKILDHKVVGRGRTRRKKYRIRWTGYGPEHDDWVSEADVEELQALDDYEKLLVEREEASRRRREKE